MRVGIVVTSYTHPNQYTAGIFTNLLPASAKREGKPLYTPRTTMGRNSTGRQGIHRPAPSCPASHSSWDILPSRHNLANAHGHSTLNNPSRNYLGEPGNDTAGFVALLPGQTSSPFLQTGSFKLSVARPCQLCLV